MPANIQRIDMRHVRKSTLVVVTGKTKKQMFDELRTMEFLEKEGIQTSRAKACYLCKRKEGETSVLLALENEDTVHLPAINLRLYEFDMGREVTFGYWLCNECAVLLSELGGATVVS